MNILELLSQRRIWVGVVFMATTIFGWLSYSFQIDIPVLTDLLTAWGNALSGFIMASLALWSFLKPKK